ncbi:MAG: TlpA family protein disulfide reductase [Cyclobacteriaceae bacterium]|nr:TlpA family protein disulfide reductase [Cyclobacteriaceae bacterium]
MRKLFLVFLFFTFQNSFSQLKIKGTIVRSNEWQSKMYILRIDYLELMPPILIDSIPISINGSFEYLFKNQNPQALLYKIMIPPKGGNFRSQIDGFADNYFLITTEEKGTIEVKANADSLFYSYEIVKRKNGLNNKLNTFRDFKRPLYKQAKQLNDSIESDPDKSDIYKQKFVPYWIEHVEDAKKKIINFLDTTNNVSLALAGFYYLYGANFGSIDSKTIKKYFPKIESAHDVLLVKNIERLMGKQASNRLNKVVPNFDVQTLNGKMVSLYSVSKKMTIIDFWASWCGPCRYSSKHELPKLNDTLKRNGIQLIGVSIDENPDKWVSAVKKDKLEWSSYRDGENLLKSFLGVDMVPLYLVLDEHRKIIFETSSVYQLDKFIAEKIL